MIPHALVLALLAAVSLQAATPRAGSLDSLTLFTFSQSQPNGVGDTQVTRLRPQLNLRSWNAWKGDGAKVSDFNRLQIEAMRAKGILFQGGLTASVVFPEDAPSDSAFLDWISRDANGDTVSYDFIVPGARRGTLSSPGFRAYLVKLAKVQIDAGVDGLFFDEVNSGFEGSQKWGWNGNEGFDDHRLRAFNRYLLASHPGWSRENFRRAFGMDSANALDPALPAEDLVRNFDYRRYLASKGWNEYPGIKRNPLAAVWGTSVQNRMFLHGKSFVESSTTAWWGEIVDSVRAYAASVGRVVHIASNGIAPFVDLNCVGLYEFNKDSAGRQVDYVPLKAGKLDGARRLGPAFRRLREASATESDSAPTVLFLDWPTEFMNAYYRFSPRQKLDYWRLFGAEAYANGVFWAFPLRTSMPGDPTAASMGILDSLGRLMDFYRRNAALYHGVEWFPTVATVPATVAATSAWSPLRRHLLLHLINHDYADTLRSLDGAEVKVALDAAPLRVFAVSPDRADTMAVTAAWKDSQLTLGLDRLDSYAVIVLELPDGTRPTGVSGVRGSNPARRCCVERSGGALRWKSHSRGISGRNR